MKLQFDSSQQYQLDAIQAIVDLFEGQPLEKGEFEFSEAGWGSGYDVTQYAFGNFVTLSPEQLLKNLHTVQGRNQIAPDAELQLIRFAEGHRVAPQFTVEMETGTGKTYVYLRTAYELNRVYGFRKFVIVVPSVAIREGVMKTLQITREHFQQLYERPPVHFEVYDSRKVSTLRNFMSSNSIQILVINIDSFAKDENVINQERDSTLGRKPIEFIQATQPFVIVDEPQNMETEIRRKAIENLNPACVLRYSATHRNPYNMVYKLDPVRSYDLGLVKQIVVDSVYAKFSENLAFVSLEDIKPGKTKITAKVKIEVNGAEGVSRKVVNVDNKSHDLYKLSNEREVYKDMLVTAINAGENYIELSNGEKIYKGQSVGGFTDAVMRKQLQDTVREHFEKERKLKAKGIKVLSLIFIDRVANYREYDETGNPVKGKFALWFEEIYSELAARPEYKDLIPFPATQVHDGYFSQDKKGLLKDTTGETKADDDTYSLIMKEKERLLDSNEPLRFIFSHSALREGWDNPNVFQICTLNETKSDLKKRQEIGRGLRLCVDETGNRVYDKNINVLTVVANDSYEDFAKQLQKEISEDCGVDFSGRLKKREDKTTVRIRKGFETDERFLDLWNRIKHKTKYRVAYDTPALIEFASKAVKEMPEVRRPQIVSERTQMNIGSEGLTGAQTGYSVVAVENEHPVIPDVMGYIQNKTELTRTTILQILRKSGRLREVLINPQMFLDLAVAAIRRILDELMVDGIRYHRKTEGDNEHFFMELFEEEFDSFKKYIQVRNAEKTLYDRVEVESGVEEAFAEKCDTNENVEFFLKLPHAFFIETPIGRYSPDWAIVFKGESRIYFVAETKADLNTLRQEEKMKIKCGAAHFVQFKNEDVEYKVVTRFEDLIG